MTGNRYRRDIQYASAGRYGFTVYDNRLNIIAVQGTGYTSHADADADARFYITQLSGQTSLLPTMTNDQPTIATQKGLF
jgi:hypothetical protein